MAATFTTGSAWTNQFSDSGGLNGMNRPSTNTIKSNQKTISKLSNYPQTGGGFAKSGFFSGNDATARIYSGMAVDSLACSLRFGEAGGLSPIIIVPETG